MDEPTTRAQLVEVHGEEITLASFMASGSGLLSEKMELLALTGTMAVSQANSNLVVATGTTANSEFLARSLDYWSGCTVFKHKMILSQRIANQNFMVLMADKVADNQSVTINSATSITVNWPGHPFTSQSVGQSMFIGGIIGASGVPGRYAIASVPGTETFNMTVAGWPASGSCTVDLFGLCHQKVLYNGTTATNALFDAACSGWASGDTTLTINTTASPGTIVQTSYDGRTLSVGDTLVASSTAPTTTTRGSRVENIPGFGKYLYVYVWAYNGTTNPASTTTMTMGFWSVENMSSIPTYIAGARQNGTANPIPVTNTGTATISGTVTANQGTLTAPTTSNINSAATTNATSIKGTAGTIYAITCSNAGAAAAFVKLYNKATSPTVGTDVPVITIPIPAASIVSLNMGVLGHRFATGIGLAITNLVADSDTTAVAVNQVKVITSYI